MTVYNKASLVLAESPAYKAGKIQPYYPLTPDVSFDFTRATSATRVNASGNIEKETQNLLVQSNTFDTTWTLTGATSITGGQAGYDGSNDAWLLETSSSAGSKRVQQSISVGGVKSYSVYAKAGTANFLIIGGAVNARYFDLVNGSVGTLIGPPSLASIESVGNGWYRCTMIEVGTTSVFQLYIADADGSTSTSIGDNIYIQDTQLEQGLVARNYQETTTAEFYGGITDNIPRLDYTDSSCPALLLEPQRTNLLSHSEYISGYDSNTTTTFNYGESPEGFDNSIRVQVNSSGYAQKAQAKGGLTANTTYTFSFWLSSESDSADMRIYDNSNGSNIIASTPLTIPDSGWERVTQTFTTPAGCTSINVYCLANAGKTAGDVTITWGWQLEEGSYATSYIPTYGTSVTRNVAAASKTGISSLIGQTEGTLFIDFLYESSTSGNRFSISDGTATNWLFIATPESGTSSRFYIRVNNSVIVDAGASSYFVNGQQYKLALAYKSGNWAAYGNGIQLYNGTHTIPSFSSPIDTINFKSYNPSDVITEREKVNQVLFFDTRLSNEELAALTTL